MCVRLMLKGEVAALTSTWRHAYEGRADAPAGLTPGSEVSAARLRLAGGTRARVEQLTPGCPAFFALAGGV